MEQDVESKVRELVEEIWCHGYQECLENAVQHRAGVLPVKTRDALVKRMCGLFERPAGVQVQVLLSQQDELPKLKAVQLDTEEEKTAWGHYSAGYSNAQQDMLREGWRKCPPGEGK